jgi:hypothetical protein
MERSHLSTVSGSPHGDISSLQLISNLYFAIEIHFFTNTYLCITEYASRWYLIASSYLDHYAAAEIHLLKFTYLTGAGYPSR